MSFRPLNREHYQANKDFARGVIKVMAVIIALFALAAFLSAE
jgi:hypothetical protein